MSSQMCQIGKVIKLDRSSINYPDKLRNIPDPPKILYCVGDISLLERRSVAVVGSRRFTQYGKEIATQIGKALGLAEIPLVSGLARGIDGFTHQGAMEAGGIGIGVLGNGFNHMSPASNYKLMLRLLDRGLVVSELEPDMLAKRFTFAHRNRIISGLSDAVIVVEANSNSGALITAKYAMDQGRDVYAVPANITSEYSLGSNLLIRDGAIPLIVINDLITELGGAVNNLNKRSLSLGSSESKIYDIILTHDGVTVDELSRILSMKTSEINSIVTLLEIKGIIISILGKLHIVNY